MNRELNLEVDRLKELLNSFDDNPDNFAEIASSLAAIISSFKSKAKEMGFDDKTINGVLIMAFTQG